MNILSGVTLHTAFNRSENRFYLYYIKVAVRPKAEVSRARVAVWFPRTISDLQCILSKALHYHGIVAPSRTVHL